MEVKVPKEVPDVSTLVGAYSRTSVYRRSTLSKASRIVAHCGGFESWMKVPGMVGFHAVPACDLADGCTRMKSGGSSFKRVVQRKAERVENRGRRFKPARCETNGEAGIHEQVEPFSVLPEYGCCRTALECG